MRFNYEELCNIDCPDWYDEDEYTIIGSDDEHVPQLRLPRRAKRDIVLNDNVGVLDSGLVELINNLDLNSKIPGSGKLKSGVWRRKTTSLSKPNNKPTGPAPANLSHEPEIFLSLRQSLAKSISTKLETLEKDNAERVQEVKNEKERIRKEQQRIEEEQKRRAEEQARIKREEAERQRQKAEMEREQQLEEQRRKEEEQKRLQEERKKQEAIEKKLKAQEEAKKVFGLTDFRKVEDTFKHYKHKIKGIKSEIVEPVKKDANLKSILSKHKRRINPKFGQLTNSEQHLVAISSELSLLVDETKANHLGYQWILNFIAKALVSQAETEVRVKPESALPLGKLALNLLARYPELLDFLMARFVKKCPLVIGFTCNIDSEEGRYKMGWKRAQNDSWEEETSYDERMGGIATLFSVITRLPLPPDIISSQVHPLPIAHSWQMLARFANTPTDLLTNTHFVVLGSWWDAAAAQFVQAYRTQAHKLLRLITNELTNAVAERKYVGAARLRILSEDYETSGTLKSFPEMSA
ncbi:LAQU0S16e00430g1_1 [Lachancea quebecensis]|uniref:mRNA export factor GLE1 n=1 Tax=Lachancea quebecensis TaxID=1654605 RepID=A0A0P1KW20_9SACH|nr:LAQU0S16e00430g1_1 [Lachancea quebecensis]